MKNRDNNFSLDAWEKMDNSEKYNGDVLQRLANEVASLSLEDKISFLNSNLLAVEHMCEEDQREFINDNIYNLKFASYKIQSEMVGEKVTNLPYCSNSVQCMFVKNNPNLYQYCSVKVKRDILTLKLLDPSKITMETLDSYLSSNYDNLSLNELRNYMESVNATDRKDKIELVNYINYLVVNIEKKRALFDN